MLCCWCLSLLCNFLDVYVIAPVYNIMFPAVCMLYIACVHCAGSSYIHHLLHARACAVRLYVLFLYSSPLFVYLFSMHAQYGHIICPHRLD
jgi:hypothetical protein